MILAPVIIMSVSYEVQRSRYVRVARTHAAEGSLIGFLALRVVWVLIGKETSSATAQTLLIEIVAYLYRCSTKTKYTPLFSDHSTE